MKLKRNNKGFSLAEMLVVVAIIVILMGVAFIAVQNHQRSMTRLEFDGIAKEIFIAAQNHLTTAEGQGYLQQDKYGTAGTLSTDSSEGVYIASKDNADAAGILELMLPFGAVDETIRAGGTYLIRYQPSSGTVLDVFYSLPGPGRSSMLTIAGKQLTASDYEDLMGSCRGEESIPERNKQVVGWYGGAEALPVGKRLESPIVIVHNEEILWVEIRDKNQLTGGASLRLTVKGDVSDTRLAFDLNTTDARSRVYTMAAKDGYNRYAVILDDITSSSMNLWNLTDINGKRFNPGENLSVEAIAFNNSAITNVAYSGKNTTNSLFADIETATADGNTTYSAQIENFRHFENLDKTISGFEEKTAYKNKEDVAVTITSARQLSDMDWKNENNPNAFVGRIHELRKSFNEYYDPTTVTVYKKDSTAATSTSDTFYPVSDAYQNDADSTDYVLSYDGGNHRVSNIKVEHNGDSGLFGTLSSGSAVNNLELIDFEIKGTTSAGALVGTATGTEITNVVAHNSEAKDSTFNNSGDSAKPNVTATGAAGGLIGSMSGGSVTKSAAAVYVKGGTDAGGLIGSAASGEVKACYSGGHTYSGVPTGAAQKYDDAHKDVYPVRYYDADNNPMYNVTTTGGTAGGLIGSAGAATISNSYSTCSASGTTAGGFVGTGGAISNCYCTGLVKGTSAEGAFAASANSVSGSHFFEIINERRNTDSNHNPVSGYEYLQPLGDVTLNETTGVTAFDSSADTYNIIVGAQTAWKDAIPYDAGGTETFGLKVYYKKTDGKTGYNLQTVEQLSGGDGSLKTSAGDTTDYFVATHYGDWPAPEEFIFN